jgi:hypothetical protein
LFSINSASGQQTHGQNYVCNTVTGHSHDSPYSVHTPNIPPDLPLTLSPSPPLSTTYFFAPPPFFPLLSILLLPQHLYDSTSSPSSPSIDLLLAPGLPRPAALISRLLPPPSPLPPANDNPSSTSKSSPKDRFSPPTHFGPCRRSRRCQPLVDFGI